MSLSSLRFGVCLWNQYTNWPQMVDGAHRAEALGFETVWTWDHMYPVIGSSRGPTLEGWLAITAIAQATKRVRVGLLVCANTYREPTLVAKMVTTLDHVSGGRAILGIGAAWHQEEHQAFGFQFGTGPERLQWLGEALPIIRAMLRGEEPTAVEGRYRPSAARNLPPPIQSRLPILVGGGGEKVTLRLVAKYADMCNFTGAVDESRRREPILRAHCDAVGRDQQEIERTATPQIVIIRDSRREALRVYEETILAQGGGTPRPLTEPPQRFDYPASQPVGTVEDVTNMLRDFVELGYRHLIFSVPPPYDQETLAQLMRVAKPALERDLASS